MIGYRGMVLRTETGRRTVCYRGPIRDSWYRAAKDARLYALGRWGAARTVYLRERRDIQLWAARVYGPAPDQGNLL